MALIASLLFLVSCQQDVQEDLGDDPVVPPPVVTSGNFRAKIDGAQFVAARTEVQIVGGRIAIIGEAQDHKGIVMTLEDHGVAHYQLDAASLSAGIYADSLGSLIQLPFATNDSDDPNLAGGEVNITSIDQTNKKISGNFAFNVYRMDDGLTHHITEGTFTDLPYITEITSGATTDTFRAKVNGADYPYQQIFAFDIGTQITVSATSSDGSKSLGVLLPSDITTGPHAFEDIFSGGTTLGLYNPDTDPQHSQSTGSGTLNILEFNQTSRRLRGTFSFHAQTLVNGISSEITAGYFSVKLN